MMLLGFVRRMPCMLLLAVAILHSPPAAAVDECPASDCIQFPADAGYLNVRDFGAVGDGAHDDTEAINAALAASGGDTGTRFWQDKIVYLPRGTYLVSAPLLKRYADGRFASGSILIGESRSGTVIRLKNSAEGYGDPAAPRAVIFTTSKLLDSPTGRDYDGKGEGNDAYNNFVENLTIDVGGGNPGAIAIDYLANNFGALRRLNLRAGEGSGLTGISMTRRWPGPAMLKDIRIEGFQTGIDVAQTEYSLTLENIDLQKQGLIGLRNNRNVVAMRSFTITDVPQPLINAAPEGLMVLIDGRVSRSALENTDEAFQNTGTANIRNVRITGYGRVLGQSNVQLPIDSVYQGSKRLGGSRTAMSLIVFNPPEIYQNPVRQWVSVTAYGIKPDSDEDATDAIRAAFASGAATVYFPHGTYKISDNILIPPTVRRIVGMTSTITAHPRRKVAFRRDLGMFRAQNTKYPLSIEHLAFDHHNLGDQYLAEASGMQPLYLRDIIGAGSLALYRPAAGGKLFVENFSGGQTRLEGKEGVWMRQLNSEGGGARVINAGAPLWVLGVKTEGNCTVVDNQAGATTEIMGGLVYIVRNPAIAGIPAFRNIDGRMVLSYAEESFAATSTYAIHLANQLNGVSYDIPATSLPLRTFGRMVPQITSAVPATATATTSVQK